MNSAYASAPVGIHGSVNSSDEDMIDIQHSGTTSDLNANGRLTGQSGPNSSRNGGDEESTAPGDWVKVDELPEPGMGQYDDFHTIDWLRDTARDRMRHR